MDQPPHEFDFSFLSKRLEAVSYSPHLNGEDAYRQEIARRMLLTGITPAGEDNVSFTRYMITAEEVKPDIIFCTVNSAIPLADAIRGWKEVYGSETPVLAPIFANSTISTTCDYWQTVRDYMKSAMRWLDIFSDGGRRPELERYVKDLSDLDIPSLPAGDVRLTYNSQTREEASTISIGCKEAIIEAETKRLARRYMGCTAMVFEQYVYTGNTLDLATNMLEGAGTRTVASTPQSKWYHQFVSHSGAEIDYANMTTCEGGFMRAIGRKAAEMSA